MAWLNLNSSKATAEGYVNSNPSYTPNWWLWSYPTDCWTVYHMPSSTGIPQTFMFDWDGHQRYQRLGKWTKAAMEPILEELLGIS